MSTTLTSTLPGINAVVAAIHTAGRSECNLADPVIIASDTLPKLRFESLTDVTGWEAYGLLCLSQPDHWMSGHLTCVRGYILGAAVGLDADHDTYVLVEYPTPLPQRVPGANLGDGPWRCRDLDCDGDEDRPCAGSFVRDPGLYAPAGPLSEELGGVR